MSSPRATVAILNGSADVFAVLDERLRPEHVTVVHAYLRPFRDGTDDLSRFIATHNPAAVVWDIAVPYVQNWDYLETVRRSGALHGRTLIVTSPNAARLAHIVGNATGALEIAGEGSDLQLLVDGIRRASLAL